MNYIKVMAMIGELKTFLAMMDSPETRWDNLQAWLRANPRWGKPVNRYVNCTPDEALTDLRQFIVDETEVPEALLKLAITPEIEEQAKRSILRLQTMYKERKAEDSQPRAYAGDEWIEDKSPIPSGHKSIDDYQSQLKAKKKRNRKH